MSDRPRAAQHVSEDVIKTGEFVEAAERILEEARLRRRQRAARLRRTTSELDFSTLDLGEVAAAPCETDPHETTTTSRSPDD